MWLLDANLDVHLVSLLRDSGISCDAATRRHWGMLDNGSLVATAVSGGFTCLLTQDRLFGESAAAALKRFPDFAVVVIQLPQRPWREYREQFRAAWDRSPIQPVRGAVITWPTGARGE